MYNFASLFPNNLKSFLSQSSFTIASKDVKLVYPSICNASFLNCVIYSFKVSLEPYLIVKISVVNFHWSHPPKNRVTNVVANFLNDPTDFLFNFLNHSLAGPTKIKENALHHTTLGGTSSSIISLVNGRSTYSISASRSRPSLPI